MTTATQQAPATAPALRQDLELIAGAPGFTGASRWLIYDPVQHRFIAIDRAAYALLQVWADGRTLDALISSASENLGEVITARDVERFIAFLQAHRLTVEAHGVGWKTLAAAAEHGHGSLSSRLLHSYLFFRVPLFRPERFLRATLGAVRPLASRFAYAIYLLLCCTGLYLVSREWDVFHTSLAGLFSFHGGLLLGLAMLVVKMLHELGHAYVATHYGCRVPVIGIAFVLGAPMLYCDVTDAWRLKSRRQRLAVDVAGIAVDLVVASIATFVWAFLPDGPARGFAFSLATAGWLLSLAMNLNPFMKFDGYHIASDFVGIANMQERAMALGRWRLRETLFALQVPPPERWPRTAAAALTAYACAIWLYRLILFTGIALAVYAYFFKLAGVFLFVIEIGYFILAPIGREIREWFAMRRAILASKRTLYTASACAGLGICLCLPLSTEVIIPAVLGGADLARLYPALPAEVAKLHVAHGTHVEAGAPLVSMRSRDVAEGLLLTRLKADVVNLRLARRTSDPLDREEALVLETEMAALQQRHSGLLRQAAELDMKAPFSGHIVEIADALHTGRWLNPREPVLVIKAEQGAVLRGYLDERDVWRVRTTTRAKFVPDEISLPRIKVKLTSIAQSASAVLDQFELAASHGGRIADRLDGRRQPIPATAQFPVRAEPTNPLPDVFATRSVAGVIIAEGSPESIIARAWRQVLKVLVRESGV